MAAKPRPSARSAPRSSRPRAKRSLPASDRFPVGSARYAITPGCVAESPPVVGAERSRRASERERPRERAQSPRQLGRADTRASTPQRPARETAKTMLGTPCIDRPKDVSASTQQCSLPALRESALTTDSDAAKCRKRSRVAGPRASHRQPSRISPGGPGVIEAQLDIRNRAGGAAPAHAQTLDQTRRRKSRDTPRSPVRRGRATRGVRAG